MVCTYSYLLALLKKGDCQTILALPLLQHGF